MSDERHRIALDEIDAAGVVFAPTAIAIAHRAYERAALARGLDLARAVRERVIALPLVRVEADFRAPLRHGDEIAIATTCARVGDTNYAMRIELSLGATVAVAVTQVHACIEIASGRSRTLPPWLRQILAAWERRPPAG